MSIFRSISKEAALQLILMLSWLALYQSAGFMEYSPHASLWYPPAALSFAAMTLLGARVFPGLFLASLLTSLWHFQQNDAAEQVPYFAVVLTSFAHTGSYLLGAMLLRLFIKIGGANYSAAVVAYFILAAAAAFLAALAGSWSLQFESLLDNPGRQAIWLGWWIGDLVAILSLSPFLLLLIDKLTENSLASRLPWLLQHGNGPLPGFLLKLLVCLLLLTVSMLIAHQVRAQEMTFLILFLSFPAMWLVYTESVWRSFSGLAVISFAIVLLMALLDLAAFGVVYQFTIAMLSVSMLYGTAVPVLQNTNKNLLHSLQTDPLTGVLSRQGFFEQAEMLLGWAKQHKDKICLAVIDLDHFKQVNDVLGHQVGDKVLQQVCQTLNNQIRQQDLLGRFGGDELMLLLPDTENSEALQLCERLRDSIEQLQIKVLKGQVTVTFGVCQHQPEEGFSQLFLRADKTLLKAKQLGRNRVEFDGSSAVVVTEHGA